MSKKLVEVPDYHFVGNQHGKWIKVPGRLTIAMEFKVHSRVEAEAHQIATSTSRLTGHRLSSLEKRLAGFIQSHLDLTEYLHTSLGDIPIKADSARIGNLWHMYLLRGRELIDELGKVVHVCFGLRQEVNGFNEKKLASLRQIIAQAQRKLEGLDPLIDCLDKHETNIVIFIALRNRAKTNDDTIIDLPWISEAGVPSGGIIGEPTKQFRGEFVGFVADSYARIIDFTKTILGAH